MNKISGAMPVALISLTCVGVFMVGTWTRADAEEFVSGRALVQTEGTWSLTVPKGWRRGSQDRIDLMNSDYRSRHTEGLIFTNFLSLYVPDDADGSYVIVSVLPIPLRGASFKSFESIFGSSEVNDVDEYKSRMFLDMRPNQTGSPQVLDRKNGELLSFGISKLENGTDLLYVHTGKVGADGVVFIQGFAPRELFDRRRSEFEAFVAGIRFKPGHEFVPTRDPISLPQVTTKDVINAVRLAAIVALVLLLPVLLIKRLRRKAQEPSA